MKRLPALRLNLLFRVVYRLFPRVGKAWRTMEILLARRGYWKSLEGEMPAGADGLPLPWITYPAQDWLSRLDFSKARVLEYGCGQSSLWWAAQASQVTSVESCGEWAEKMRAKAPAHLDILGPVEGDAYVKGPLAKGGLFDVIVVDGIRRLECAQASLPSLAAGGIMILDNSDWHADICRWLCEQGCCQVDFHGLGPQNDYAWCTSVFFRERPAFVHRHESWPPEIYGTLPPRA